MASFALRRLGAALLLLFVVLTSTFFLVHLAPGEPSVFYTDIRLSPEVRDHLRELYGLDQPLVTQYGRWMAAALRGDLGVSISHRRSAARVLLDRLPATAVLIAAALVVEYVLGILVGMLAAVYAGGVYDHVVRVLSLVAFAVPSFWLGLVLIDLLAVRQPLFPVAQMSSLNASDLTPLGRFLDLLHHLVLPALALGLSRCGAVVRFLRNSLLEVLDQDYVRTARALGLPRSRVLFVHALKNAVSPLVQRFGLSLPMLFSGSLVIEVVFTWPGLGQLTFAAVLERDYPLVLASTVFAGVSVVTATFFTDLLHAWVDPRVRVDGQ